MVSQMSDKYDRKNAGSEKQKFEADHVISYFKMEWKVLLAVTVSGLIYNLGLLAGACFVKKCVYLVKEIRLNYLTYRQIDVHSQIKPCVSPLFALSACDPYYVLAQEIDIAKSFRHRDKFGRGNLTELRWIPPHKRFTAHKLLFRAAEYRLIVRREMCKAVCDILVHKPFKFDLP